jgi:hypothetical protein
VHTTVLSVLIVAALVVAWRPRRRAADEEAGDPSAESEVAASR